MPKRWVVVAHDDQRDYRTICPVSFDSREQAERLGEVMARLVPPSLRITVEERDVEDSEN